MHGSPGPGAGEQGLVAEPGSLLEDVPLLSTPSMVPFIGGPQCILNTLKPLKP